MFVNALEALDKMVSEVKKVNLPPLGPAFSELPPEQLREAMVRHRIQKAYEKPDNTLQVTRRELSIARVIQHDSGTMDSFSWRLMEPESRRDFLAAREWLRLFFRDFRHQYSLVFPSGESFVSSRGHNDMLQKLRGTVHWSVSPDNVRYIVEIAKRNRGLKSIIRDRFRSLYGSVGLRTLRKVCTSAIKHGLNPHHEGIHFMFRACCTLSRMSRVTTVRKDNESDRVITCESLWNMIAQLSYARSLRSHMRSFLGFDLETRQDVHRALVRTGKSTVDMKSASDNNLMVVLQQLLPSRAFQDISRIRTGIFLIKGGRDGDLYHPLRMFAPMGCGCTFELMTLVLLAHCRVLDPGSSVFGDDIIIEEKVAARLCRNLESQGWIVNHNKSFLSGPFRESCGSFADLRTNKFILSYELQRPTDWPSFFLVCHKVVRLIYSLPSGPIRRILLRFYADVHRYIPHDAFVELDSRTVNPYLALKDWCFHTSPSVLRNLVDEKSNVHTKRLSLQWQRPVFYRTVTRETYRADSRRFPRTLRYFLFLKKGRSYIPDSGEKEVKTERVLVSCGTSLRKCHIIGL